MGIISWIQNKVCLENYTLILPSISVGNVGQLAVDLLINNLHAQHIAYIHHPCFLPMIGSDPFNMDNLRLMTSCQLYECKEKKLAIIQGRSPMIPGRDGEFRAWLVDFIKEFKIKKTVMLCSTFSQFFTIKDLEGVPMHYLCSAYPEEDFQKLSWKTFALPANVNESETSPIPGGGIAKQFLEDCKKENIPLVVLILVCSEGNNYPEAFQMVDRLNSWLPLKENDDLNKWRRPISWALPYGSGAPASLY